MLDGPALLSLVREQITELLAEAEIEHGEITGTEPLNGVGLSSLLLARLVIQLEMELGVDPFAEGDVVISDIRTVEGLADAYAAVLNPPVTA